MYEIFSCLSALELDVCVIFIAIKEGKKDEALSQQVSR